MRKLALVLIALILSACSAPKGSDQSAFTWQISAKEVVVAKVLSDKATVTHYDGSSEIVIVTDTPSSGKVYVLIHLDINKAKAGGSAFNWDKLTLVDTNKISHARLNDDFLTRHNKDRLPGITLSLGDNDGWIAFEVDTAVSAKTMTLTYQADEGINKVLINP